MAIVAIVAKVSAHDTIVIGGSEWLPFEYQEEGANKGSDVEIVLEAFERMNTPVEIKFYSWKRCVIMAQRQKLDGIFSLRSTSEREKFSELYTKNGCNVIGSATGI